MLLKGLKSLAYACGETGVSGLNRLLLKLFVTGPSMSSAKEPYTRSRNLDSLTSYMSSNRQIVVRKSDGVVIEDKPTIAVVSVKNTDKMDDVVTPGFELIKSNGGIVNSPMSKVSRHYTSGVGGFSGFNDAPYFSNMQTNSWSRVAPCVVGAVGEGPHTINVNNLKTLASVKALAGMKPSTFQGFVAIAEGAKTLRMLLNPLASANSLLKYVIQQRQAKKNLYISNTINSITINGKTFTRHQPRYRGPGRIVKPPKGNIVVPFGDAISGTVLANNLGLRPLMMDLDALLKEIPQLHQYERLTSRETLSDESTITTNGNVSSHGGLFSHSYTTETKTTIKVRATVLYEDRFDIKQDFGVSLWDIPEAAWELIPYSFILDYFVNIGDVLAANHMVNTRKIISSCLVVTTDKVTTRTFTGTTSSQPTWTITKGASGSDVLTVKEKIRQPYLENIMLAYTPISKAFRPTVMQNLLSIATQYLVTLGKPTRRAFH